MRSFISFMLAITLGISAGSPGLLSQQKLKLAVVPKGDDSFFWKSFHAGVLSGAETAGGVTVEWAPPKTAQNVQQQIALVDRFAQEGVAGIALSPTDYAALAAPVARAMKKGIPVVVFDSRLKGEPGKDFVGFVATNSKSAGMLAAEEMSRLLGEKGTVTVLRYTVGQANLNEREDGFLEGLRKYPKMQSVIETRTSKPTRQDVEAFGEDIIDKLKASDGLFCSNETITEGMLSVLRKNGLAGKIKFIGFDTSDPLVEALKKGEIDALVAQDPTRMGYFAVKTLVDHIRGSATQPIVDIEVRVITRQNVTDPDVQKLLSLPELIK